MGRSYRPNMLGSEIQRVLSDMLVRGELKDPAFQNRMIGINSVDVSRDGSYATLYITVLSFTPGKETTAEDKKEVLEALKKSAGFIRTEIGKAVKVRHIPELRFSFDESFEYGMKMDKILDGLKK
ncbi:MAG: 30S ribosome-binding factor RbfA [Bacillota bacterium]|nr:30S ribosome-binding factor RbfA [Bacillota bacterium]